MAFDLATAKPAQSSGGFDLSTAKPVEAAAPSQEPSIGQAIKQQVGNVAAGLVRGAGSLGATLLTPLDYAARTLGIQNDFIGRTDRRQAMDEALSSLGADTNSLAYKGGKLGAEVAGTLGVGGALGAVAKAAGMTRIGNALATSGMTTGTDLAGANALARAADMGVRMVGGAATGGAAAGLVNPDDALTGVVVGAAMPPIAKGIGEIGNGTGRVLRGPEQPADLAASIAAARNTGYVIPPSQARPSLINRGLEGFSGKVTTAQNASAKNQVITNELSARAVGLPADTKITPDVLKAVRDSAGQAYEAIGKSGTITPGQNYSAALDAIEAPFKKAAQGFPGAKPSPVLDLVESLRSPSFDAASAVEKIKALRTAADDSFRTGNTDLARASRSGAAALENAIEEHLQQSGSSDLLRQFRDARQLIAKTYSVEKALNPTTGAVDARKLANQLTRGKPLSGELKDAADFAARFPKAAQTVEAMGSLPQTSPLDWALGGSLSAATANPLAMASVLARPAARSVVLSPVVQDRLIQSQPNALQLLTNPELRQLAYRAAPVAAGGR